MIDNSNKRIKPNIFATLPNSLLANFPNFKPNIVKVKLINEINSIGIAFIMIEDNPIPVIRLSILTNMANNNKLIVFILIFFSLSNIISLKSLINRNMNIIPNNLFGGIFIIVSNLIPITLPNKGNIK